MNTILEELDKLERVLVDGPAEGFVRGLLGAVKRGVAGAGVGFLPVGSAGYAQARTADAVPWAVLVVHGGDHRREAVVDQLGRVERIPDDLCVLRALRDAIRR